MKRIIRIGFLLCAFSILAGPASAQAGGRYYPETGHTLDNRFVNFFDAHGGVEILGYPITDIFVDPENGYPIQYTQNARLEQVRQGTETTIRMPVLGELLGGWETPPASGRAPAGTSSGCRFYPESGHRICFAFIEYFDRHGGLEIFGYPISEFKFENGRGVQYFQRFRLDWHPEADEESQIQVAPLGRLHFDAMGYDPNLLESTPPQDMDQYRILELRPQVAVWKPVAQSSDTQRVYVIVRDQNLLPVAGAWVTLNVNFADQDRVLVMPPSNANGVTQIELSFEDQLPGRSINLEVLVSNGELQVSTRDSFLIWW